MIECQSMPTTVSAIALVVKRQCVSATDHNRAMSTLKERMIAARTEAKLSQGALAKLVKCGQTTIASIENGRNQSSSVLARVAAALGVNALWLAEGKGPKRPSDLLPSSDTATSSSTVASPARLPAKTKREKRIAAIVEQLHVTDDEGLAIVLDKAKDVARDYPLSAQKTGS